MKSNRSHTRNYLMWQLLSVGILLLCLLTNASAQKNDTLYFLNGDRISGEIKSYKYGYLKYKTYGVSTVDVKQEKISTFHSRKSFDILMKNGSRRFGSFDTSNIQQFVKIITLNDSILTPLLEIVEITPIKNRFWRRITGSVDLGLSYTKATTIAEFSFASEINYQTKNYYSNISLNTNNTQQDEKSPTHKNDITFSNYRRIKNNWFGVGSASAEQNSELGLDLRLQAILGISNELVHTNINNLLATIGLVVNREWSLDTISAQTNYDAVGALNYRVFRFKDPEISITTAASAYPSFSAAGRWRLYYDLKAKFEIVSDLYFGLSFYTNYDSKPPSTTSSNLDYSVTTSIGYSF